jgi:hypothetical protein
MSAWPIANNDIWLHLKTGALIWQRGAVPQVDEYTFTRAGSPYIAHEWLAQVFFARAYGAGGVAALDLVKFLLIGMTLWLIYAGIRRSAAAVVTCWAVLLIATHLAIRPHLFTFALTALFTSLLWSARGDEEAGLARGKIAALILLQILWANLHGGFVVGILLGLIFLAADLVKRGGLPARSMLLLVALAAAPLVNPYGWRLYELVARFGDPFFRTAIVEWESPFESRFAATPQFWLYIAWLVVAIVAAVRSLRSRREAAPALTLIVFATLSFTSRRHISLLAIVTAPWVGEQLAGWVESLSRGRERLSRAAASAGSWTPVVLAVLLAAQGAVLGDAKTRAPSIGIAANVPVEALEVMRAEGLHGRVFTDMGFGGYVTWRGWPDLLTCIDSRLEVFGGDFIRRYMIAARDPDAFREFSSGASLDFALLPWGRAAVAGALEQLQSDPQWALIYFDDVAALYARRGPGSEDLIRRRALGAIDPKRFVTRGELGEGVDPIAAEAEARRAAAGTPVISGRPAMNAVAHAILGSALLRQRRFSEAVPELRAGIAGDSRLAPVWGMLGMALMGAGDTQGARAAFAELKRHRPGSELAERMLREIE